MDNIGVLYVGISTQPKLDIRIKQHDAMRQNNELRYIRLATKIEYIELVNIDENYDLLEDFEQQLIDFYEPPFNILKKPHKYVRAIYSREYKSNILTTDNYNSYPRVTWETIKIIGDTSPYVYEYSDGRQFYRNVQINKQDNISSNKQDDISSEEYINWLKKELETQNIQMKFWQELTSEYLKELVEIKNKK